VTPLLLTWAGEALAATPHGAEAQDLYTPLGVLIAGIAVAYVYLSNTAGTDADASIEEEAREIDLGATRDEVVEALRQLEVEKPKMDPGQYEIERQQLLARGSKALRELDGAEEEEAEAARPASAGDESAPAAAASDSQGPMAIWNALAPEWRGAISALTVVALIGGLLWMMQSDTRERREGDPITGSDIVTADNTRPSGLERANPQTVAQIEALETQLKENPQDIEALNTLTQLYLSASAPEKAFEYNRQVRELEPTNKDARAYLGVLRMMMGMTDTALAAFDEVLEEDPQHLLSHFYKGLVLLELRRFDEAVATFERAVEIDPNNPNLARALSDAKALASGEMPSPEPAATGDLLVRGTLDIDPAAKASLTGREVVFVSLKDPTQAGPPVAAIKAPAQFPAPFQITKANMMAMGAATVVPDQLLLTARIDLDGNAMTKEDAPSFTLSGIQRGAEGVRVVLSKGGGSASAPAAAPPAAAGGGGDALVSGTATLAPGKDASGVLFISLMPATGGPPVAAKRIPGASFPFEFSLTKSDMIPMMAGRPIPDQLILKLHVDRDGNASTKEDGPAAVLPSIAPGTRGVSLRLE